MIVDSVVRMLGEVSGEGYVGGLPRVSTGKRNTTPEEGHVAEAPEERLCIAATVTCFSHGELRVEWSNADGGRFCFWFERKLCKTQTGARRPCTSSREPRAP
jgi:hypothetical protein